MEIHNTTEDLVVAEVDAICDSLRADEKQPDICLCNQCRQDIICYVLNRTEPHYVVSHRGAARVTQEADQQSRADLTALVYEGIKLINRNQRPYFDHKHTTDSISPIPSFNIPTIMGQVLSGLNFSPITGIAVELVRNGKLAEMKDKNWQNPYTLIANTGGTFTFWPKAAAAEKINIREVFEFSVRIAVPGFAELNHVFTIPVVSELGSPSFSLSRTFKLPDLYLFPPGEEKNQLIITE